MSPDPLSLTSDNGWCARPLSPLSGHCSRHRGPGIGAAAETAQGEMRDNQQFFMICFIFSSSYFVPSWVRTRASPSVGAPGAGGRSITATGSCWRPPSSRRTGSHWCRRPSCSARRGSPSRSTRSTSSGPSSPQRSFPPSAPTPNTWASSFRRSSWRRPRTRSRPTR